MAYWGGTCAVTGVAEPCLLRASHIKPWARCETDSERLDVYNGLLLAAHLDAAFDAGLISFADDGGVLIARWFTDADRRPLGIHERLALCRVAAGHLAKPRVAPDEPVRSANVAHDRVMNVQVICVPGSIHCCPLRGWRSRGCRR